jgi:hypothetical protein
MGFGQEEVADFVARDAGQFIFGHELYERGAKDDDRLVRLPEAVGIAADLRADESVHGAPRHP